MTDDLHTQGVRPVPPMLQRAQFTSTRKPSWLGRRREQRQAQQRISEGFRQQRSPLEEHVAQQPNWPVEFWR